MSRRSIHRAVVTLTLTAICTTLASAESRTWTDSTGKFSVEADLQELKEDSVVLKKVDGSTVTVPLARLSVADREYLKTVTKPGETLPKDKGPPAPLVFSDALTEPPPWNDENVPFDLAAFLRAPAADENAASLCLGAFVEFSWWEMSHFFPELPEQEQKERNLAAGKLSDEQHRLDDAWEKDPKSVDYEAVDAWLANYDAGMRDEWGMEGNVTSPLACFRFFFAVAGEPSPEQSGKMAAVLQAKLLPGAWTGGKMLSDDDYAKEVRTLNHFFASILALADQRSSLWRDIEAAEGPVLETTLFAKMVIPAEGAVVDAILRHETRLRGAQCLTALRRWQLEHEAAPSNLESLVKAAGMTSVPIDPYSGEPLRIGSIAGETVIYSVGPDGRDDKAQIEWTYGPRNPGDFIFRLEIPSH